MAQLKIEFEADDEYFGTLDAYTIEEARNSIIQVLHDVGIKIEFSTLKVKQNETSGDSTQSINNKDFQISK